MLDSLVVIQGDWKEQIMEAYGKMQALPPYSYQRNAFYAKIWEMSQVAFDIPREVQVVTDDNDKLFISVGSPGFVSFDGQEEVLRGMKLPLDLWVHTHPSGDAYFSDRDFKTINIWHTKLNQAVVLGNKEMVKLTFRNVTPSTHYYETVSWDYAVTDENNDWYMESEEE